MEEKDILEEMKLFVKENKMTFRALKKYILNEKNEWYDVFYSHQNLFMELCYFSYEAAVIRNKEFYDWCKSKGLSVLDGMEQIPDDKPSWKNISISSLTLMLKWEERDFRNEMSRRSKEVKKGIPNTRKPKPVRCTDDGMEFSSINKCAQYYGIRRTQDISDCCYGLYTKVYGRHFEFIE